jgi:hypothetical protein
MERVLKFRVYAVVIHKCVSAVLFTLLPGRKKVLPQDTLPEVGLSDLLVALFMESS